MLVSDEGDIAFKSVTGLIFMLLAAATVFYVLGFGSNSWAVVEDKDFDVRQSLWQRCQCIDMDSDTRDGEFVL